ncbi:MAG TPA: nuclear transport factor 2 family protein [Terriglobales bacterium]|nr:nuclear transport factor 2 family protein [Terriglobales bacterium]
MKVRAVTVLLLACNLMVAAQVVIQDPKTEKSKLIALENAWNQAQIHRDGEALNNLTAGTFVYTDWDGTVMNKAKFIADIKDPSVQTTSVANDGVDVYFYPGVAVVTGAYRTKGVNKGKPFDHYGRFTDTWILSGGQWECVASHTNLTRKPVSR